MEIIKAYKTELNPNNLQATKFRKNFGAARYAYNYALVKKKEAMESKTKIPSAIDLHKEINKLKGTDELPWGYEVSKCSFQEALRNCDDAFKRFFKNCKSGAKSKGFPKFKSKRNEVQSFRLTGSIKVGSNWIQLPTIGKVKLKESDYLPLGKPILSATVSQHAGEFFVSIQIREEVNELPKTDVAIGVDLGIKTLATCSDGTTYNNPKAYKKFKRQLKRAQRQLARKKKGSNNRKKSQFKIQKINNKISNIRKDAIHKATSRITDENQVIVLEDLSSSGMMKNHKLAGAIGDASFYEFRRQIEYKSKWKGRSVIFVDKFFPSSKICSCCGNKKMNLKLNERTYHCDKCGNKMDRDLNASINLKQFYTVSSTGINAFGESISEGKAKALPSGLGEQGIQQEVSI
jgi:putative transposase